MRAVNSLENLNIPIRYQMYIRKYLQNISTIPYISRVILFGSCAREKVAEHSDIDLFITTNRDITEDEEAIITFYCIPEYSEGSLPTDIIVQSETDFRNYADMTSMVQKQVVKEGVDISGLLH